MLFLLLLHTGLRPGEALALKWQDLDLDQGRLSVQRVLLEKGVFAQPKTEGSRRVVTFGKTVADELRKHSSAQAAERLEAGPKYVNQDLVFATTTGAPACLNVVVRRHFKAVIKAAGLPERTRLYDLRHTCATLLLAQGEHPKIVADRLGHSTIKLTLDTYSHVLPHMQERAAEKMDDILGSKPEDQSTAQES